jgi:dihydropteroate synthase
VWAVQNGAHIIRAHDVAATVQALRMNEAILAIQPS